MTWSGQDQVFKSLSLHHLRGSLSGVKVMEICRLIIHLSCMPSEMSGTCLDCECLEDYMVYNHSQQHLIAILKTMQYFSIDQHDFKATYPLPKKYQLEGCSVLMQCT